jgi:hypothetical protein
MNDLPGTGDNEIHEHIGSERHGRPLTLAAALHGDARVAGGVAHRTTSARRGKLTRSRSGDEAHVESARSCGWKPWRTRARGEAAHATAAGYGSATWYLRGAAFSMAGGLSLAC